ncbi:hypothetical protein EM868_12575 [Cupriavidus gilardii]|uniref:DUF6708 domain-containing protein n=1 Tax=Cupriavidus gilardii TaxID=82541 RepID=UPI001EE61765|nr:DUF6708 domain-containing protein [Cupriavidus gilardii]MCG5262016.1 hypothetical protein [Cupriavidus gilardii]MDF9430627.1 hypothetical protein [Cupriavidus gilardii]
MDFTGLITNGYKKNRRIAEEERGNRLFQKERASDLPNYELAVIKINSTYLEVVDRYFDSRGAVTLFSLIGIALPTWMIVWLTSVMLETYREGLYDGVTALGVSAFVFTINFPLICFCAWAASKELRRLTHYPIRLNRENRTLYVFRLDGTILTVPWDSVFFTVGKCSSMYGKTWDIRALVLNEADGTVRDEFAFSLAGGERAHLIDHWEFLRRYMEDGPAKLVRQIEFCMPIDGKYESFRSGIERIFAPYSGHPFFYWLMSPFNVALACVRWIVMRSCTVPVWPRDIEDACRIHEGDPFVRDSRINPPNLR